MYGRIFGFQRLARCPKWTPASIRSFTWTMATHCPPAPRRVWGVDERLNQRSPNRALPSPLHVRVKKVMVAPAAQWVKGFCPIQLAPPASLGLDGPERPSL